MKLTGRERIKVTGVSPTGGASSLETEALAQDVADLVSGLVVVEALRSLPDSDQGLESGGLFWNKGFLCKKP